MTTQTPRKHHADSHAGYQSGIKADSVCHRYTHGRAWDDKGSMGINRSVLVEIDSTGTLLKVAT
jgi:hypothetical protein